MAYTRPEPLRGKRDLEGFKSGEGSLDEWLARFARHAEATGSTRVFVTTSDGEHVVGYYALTVAQVYPEDATQRLLKGQPTERPVPVILLARLAVNQSHQGHGVGRSLLLDACLRANNVSEEVGVRALVAHAIGDAARAWYQAFGFEPSPTDRLHLILLMKDLRRLLAEVEER